MWIDDWALNLPVENWPIFDPNFPEYKILFRFFECNTPYIVASSSNKIEAEVNIEKCNLLNIPILQRKGGGGVVLLQPGCLILTLAFWAKDYFNNAHYFSLVNNLWISALNQAGIKNIEQKGHSDLVINDKKIVGSSAFRRKNLFLYQGSLLVNPNMDLIFELLNHPLREPNYRNGRPHKEFISSLAELNYQIPLDKISDICSQYFTENALKFLQNDCAKFAAKNLSN